MKAGAERTKGKEQTAGKAATMLFAAVGMDPNRTVARLTGSYLHKAVPHHREPDRVLKRVVVLEKVRLGC